MRSVMATGILQRDCNQSSAVYNVYSTCIVNLTRGWQSEKEAQTYHQPFDGSLAYSTAGHNTMSAKQGIAAHGQESRHVGLTTVCYSYLLEDSMLCANLSIDAVWRFGHCLFVCTAVTTCSELQFAMT